MKSLRTYKIWRNYYFDEIIQEQINRVNAMNSLITKLKQLSEDSKKSRGSEEQRYFHLSANYVFKQLQTMIDGSKTSIHVVIDSWGLNLLSLGIMARYISNIYTEVKSRPLFHVRKKPAIKEQGL